MIRGLAQHITETDISDDIQSCGLVAKDIRLIRKKETGIASKLSSIAKPTSYVPLLSAIPNYKCILVKHPQARREVSKLCGAACEVAAVASEAAQMHNQVVSIYWKSGK